MDVPGGIYAHIAGIDVVRAGARRRFYVLRGQPAGALGRVLTCSSRKMMMRLFPELFSLNRVAPVEHYPDRLLENLASGCPGRESPIPSWCCSRPGPTTAPTSSTPSSPSRWRRTRRGPGPRRGGRLRLHAHHPGTAARGRDLPPASTTTSRPLSFRARSCRRAGPDGGRIAPAASPSRTPSAPALPDENRSILTCRR